VSEVADGGGDEVVEVMDLLLTSVILGTTSSFDNCRAVSVTMLPLLPTEEDDVAAVAYLCSISCVKGRSLAMRFGFGPDTARLRTRHSTLRSATRTSSRCVGTLDLALLPKLQPVSQLVHFNGLFDTDGDNDVKTVVDGLLLIGLPNVTEQSAT
jgi:hypothetical protein